MLVDLLQTTTRDGIRLDGILHMPAALGNSPLGVDGFCLVHGTGGNFYSSSLFDCFTNYLLERRCAVLRVNTRGHDGISTAVTSRGGRRLGAAYEIVDDCRADIAAWLDLLRNRVGQRIGLVGHSLGAVKCLYTLAQEPRDDVVCLAALSPPCLSYARFCNSELREDFRATYARAEELVESGQPAALMEVKLPLPFVITAAGYVEKYGPDERYNFLRFTSGLRLPVLFTFGGVELESNMAFRGMPDALSSVRKSTQRFEVVSIPAADHFYSGKRDELLACFGSWLESIADRTSHRG